MKSVDESEAALSDRYCIRESVLDSAAEDSRVRTTPAGWKLRLDIRIWCGPQNRRSGPGSPVSTTTS